MQFSRPYYVLCGQKMQLYHQIRIRTLIFYSSSFSSSLYNVLECVITRLNPRLFQNFRHRRICNEVKYSSQTAGHNFRMKKQIFTRFELFYVKTMSNRIVETPKLLLFIPLNIAVETVRGTFLQSSFHKLGT
jgi:hypothetical protein